MSVKPSSCQHRLKVDPFPPVESWTPLVGFWSFCVVGWHSCEVAVFEAVAVSFGGNDFCMVDEPVDHGGGGGGGVSEDFTPTSERFVGGDDDRGSFVAG